MGRLVTALSYNPEPLGVGVDEDTAAIIAPDGVLTVLGSGAVTVVDASGLRFTDSHSIHRGQPVAMLGLKVDFLTPGCRYDLKRRAGLAPAGSEDADSASEAVALGRSDG
jgi:cyanophycinase